MLVWFFFCAIFLSVIFCLVLSLLFVPLKGSRFLSREHLKYLRGFYVYMLTWKSAKKKTREKFYHWNGRIYRFGFYSSEHCPGVRMWENVTSNRNRIPANVLRLNDFAWIHYLLHFFSLKKHTHTHTSFLYLQTRRNTFGGFIFLLGTTIRQSEKKSLRALHFGKSTEKLLRIWLSRMKNKTIAFANLKCLDNKDSIPNRVIRSLVIFRYVCTSDLLLLSIFSIALILSAPYCCAE